jgi:phage/plasmid-associated DNA primase
MDLFIRDHFQQVPSKATHFHNVTKSYLDIPINAQRDFWLNYCESVSDGHNPYVCEMVGSRESIQLAYKFKLVFERQQIPCRNDIITQLAESIDVYVQHIIGTIQSMISYYFEVTQAKSEYMACYLRRDASNILIWKENTVEYDGKIVFPYAHVRKEYISTFYHYIINQLQIRSDTADEYLSIPPINSFDTLIQPINDQNLELYGSSPDENTPPLKLYETYGFLNTDVKTTFNDVSMAFVPTLHSVVSQGIITPDIITQKIQEKGIQYWLPLFFSSGYYDIPLKTREGMSLMNTNVPTITMSVIKEGGESITKLERARQLLNLISVTRIEAYWSWIDIGLALHSVDSDREGLRLWKWFTTQSDFKSEDDCEKIWLTFDFSGDVDVGTLEVFAEKDSPQKYKDICKTRQDEADNRAIQIQEHMQLAKSFKEHFPHEFICSNYEAGEWYKYTQHRWVSMNGTSDLMYYINEKYQAIWEKKQSEIAEKIAKSRDPEFKVKNQNIMTAIGQLITKLSKNGFKEGLCKELRIYYHKENFNRLKDVRPEFMSTLSGVIDLRGGTPIIRPGKPQDYITKTTRCAYPHNYTWDTKVVQETMNYLRQVFRSKSLLDYIIRLGASLLLSGNSNKIFPIFSGDGNNSKSIFVRIIETAFGSYAVKLPTSLITGGRTSADSATPTLIHSQGAKVAFLQEPNSKDVIQSGTVKEITGGVDTMYVRDLFQKGSKIVEMEVTIVPILIANKIPVIPDCQQAIWDRTRVVYFSSKWVANAPTSENDQMKEGLFQLNKFFDRNISVMAPALLWIFVQKYPEYYDDGLQDPAEVLQATENFRIANNFYIHYTRDCIKPVINERGEVDNSAFVSLDELFNTFRKWYTDQQFRAKMPNKTEFKENLEIIWRKKADPENKWYGLRLNNQASTIQSLLSF